MIQYCSQYFFSGTILPLQDKEDTKNGIPSIFCLITWERPIHKRDGTYTTIIQTHPLVVYGKDHVFKLRKIRGEAHEATLNGHLQTDKSIDEQTGKNKFYTYVVMNQSNYLSIGEPVSNDTNQDQNREIQSPFD